MIFSAFFFLSKKSGNHLYPERNEKANQTSTPCACSPDVLFLYQLFPKNDHKKNTCKYGKFTLLDADIKTFGRVATGWLSLWLHLLGAALVSQRGTNGFANVITC